MLAIDQEFKLTTAVLLANERWSAGYSRAPEEHSQLIKQIAAYNLVLIKFFKAMAAKADDFINHDHYNYQLAQTKQATLDRLALDYNVDVIVNDDQIDNWDQPFISVSLQPVASMITIGAGAAQSINQRPAGLKSTDEIIQQLSSDQVAALVGKKITIGQDGSRQIIDNPDAKYNVTQTVRNNVANSVKRSLANGDTSQEAIARMQRVIADPARAERIANTEAVNAYNSGVMEYGRQTGAVQKEWDDAGSIDICADNAAEGPIDMAESFDSGNDQPPAHPNCMCSLRLVYQDELDAQDGESVDDGGDGGDGSDYSDE